MKRLAGILIISFLFINGSILQAQGGFERWVDIPITKNGQPMVLSGLGGLNNPQFSEADLNNDGIKDLFIFDRSEDIVLTLINGGTPNQIDYTYQPNYERNFPEMYNWAMLRDFNNDNIPDLFHSGGKQDNNVVVRVGYYDANNRIAFNEASTPLQYDDEQEVFVATSDIPGIVDVDFDGDLDILSFPFSGFVSWFKNLTVENGNPIGTIELTLGDECWGDFYASGIEPFLLGEGCESDSLGTAEEEPALRSYRHPGSTFFVKDLDNDGLNDLVLGEINFDNLIMAQNTGTTSDAFMSSQDINFPSYNVPTILDLFPAAFEADVNNDGLWDMIVAPNAVAQSQHLQCVLLYLNNGNESNQLVYQTDTFLIEQTIDVNNWSNPAFFDYNSDGLLDLVVGHNAYEEIIDDEPTTFSRLALFQNVGTANEPAFAFVTRNFADLENLFFIERVHVAPTFGDIDNDGDEDMLIGDNDGKLHLFINNPTADGIAQFSNPGPIAGEEYFLIDIGQRLQPQLIDVNEDGTLDIISGQRNGPLMYFPNTGTPEVAEFSTEPLSTFWGEVDVREEGVLLPSSYSAPFLIEHEGAFKLFVGNEQGRIHLYDDIEANINEGAFNEITGDLLGERVGKYATIAVADINNDGYLDMALGNYRGGIVFYKGAAPLNAPSMPIPSNKHSLHFNIYPNPSQASCIIELTQAVQQPGHISIFSVTGKLVHEQVIGIGQQQVILNTQLLQAGIYLVQFNNASGNISQKLIVQ